MRKHNQAIRVRWQTEIAVEGDTSNIEPDRAWSGRCSCGAHEDLTKTPGAGNQTPGVVACNTRSGESQNLLIS
jgi:hypothetical protein